MQATCDGTYMNPWDYRNFKAYWEDHKMEFKRLKSKNIIWRIIHWKNWISMDGKFIWVGFLIYHNPIVPAILKGYVSYKSAVKTWKEVSSHMVDELTEEINKEILKDLVEKV